MAISISMAMGKHQLYCFPSNPFEPATDISIEIAIEIDIDIVDKSMPND
jgi:hypothetical protein